MPFGADGGGAKRRDPRPRHCRERPRRATASSIIGDNLNDVDAGLRNGVHFIGFSREQAKRRERLAEAGAATVCGDHRIRLTTS